MTQWHFIGFLMNSNKIVVFQTFLDPMQANIIKGLLVSYGIECFLSDENIVTLNPLYSNAVGGVKLHVFERDVEQIHEILQAQNLLPKSDLPDSSEQINIVCPECHSTNVSYGGSVRRKFGYLDALVAILLMIYPFSMRKVYHCFDCGHEYKKRDNFRR